MDTSKVTILFQVLVEGIYSYGVSSAFECISSSGRRRESSSKESLVRLGVDFIGLYLMPFAVALARTTTLENIIVDWELANDPYPT